MPIRPHPVLLFLATVFFVDIEKVGAMDADNTPGVCLYGGSDPGGICIRKESYGRDLCNALQVSAEKHGLPAEYFARLIWRESLFKADAVSPKGAEGIAQFMPSTAKLRGLSDTFDVVAALEASSRYLSELSRRYGNLGLAAAAYNAGEGGLAGFLTAGRLPVETRDYVFAITGHPVEAWRDNPPETAAPPLNAPKPFQEACVELATKRRLREPVLLASADWAPWGVQLAAHIRPATATMLFTNAVARLPAPLNSQRALLVRQRGGNFGYRPRYAARIGQESRREADLLCAKMKSAGGACTVFRN